MPPPAAVTLAMLMTTAELEELGSLAARADHCSPLVRHATRGLRQRPTLRAQARSRRLVEPLIPKCAVRSRLGAGLIAQAALGRAIARIALGGAIQRLPPFVGTFLAAEHGAD
jgi:hypothetical protein